MSQAIGLLVVVIYIIINCILAVVMNGVAIKKGYESSPTFILVFFFGVLGVLYVVALPDLVARQQREDILEILLKLQEGE